MKQSFSHFLRPVLSIFAGMALMIGAANVFAAPPGNPPGGSPTANFSGMNVDGSINQTTGNTRSETGYIYTGDLGGDGNADYWSWNDSVQAGDIASKSDVWARGTVQAIGTIRSAGGKIYTGSGSDISQDLDVLNDSSPYNEDYNNGDIMSTGDLFVDEDIFAYDDVYVDDQLHVGTYVETAAIRAPGLGTMNMQGRLHSNTYYTASTPTGNAGFGAYYTKTASTTGNSVNVSCGAFDVRVSCSGNSTADNYKGAYPSTSNSRTCTATKDSSGGGTLNAYIYCQDASQTPGELLFDPSCVSPSCLVSFPN
jgi:hypothetical protein